MEKTALCQRRTENPFEEKGAPFMKFAENNRISHRQLYRQMILGLLAPFLLCIPGRNGMNGLSAVLGIVAAMVFFCFYVIILIRLTPAFDNLVKAAGKVAGRITGVFFLLYILMSGGYLLALLRTLVPASLITGVSGRWIAFWAILVCSVGSRKGMPGRGRMAEVSGGLLSGGILLMMVLCIPQMEGEYLVEMVQRDHLTMENMVRSFYGAVCAFSALGLLPFLMGDVEKYGSAGKTAMWAILTIGGILVGMEFLLPAVLGYDRVRLEKYPVLPLLDGADLPGNVLARFDVIWMGFLLYSLLFSVGSLLHYGHQIVRRAHLGTGRFWMPAMIFLISLLEEEGKGILDVEKAMEPMYTTDTTGERSGMGFSFMEAFMDEVEVESKVGCGTCVTMKKRIGRGYMNKEQEEKETAESYG